MINRILNLNFIYIISAVLFSVGYLMAEDTNQAVVLLAIWAIIKYRSKLPTGVVIDKN